MHNDAQRSARFEPEISEGCSTGPLIGWSKLDHEIYSGQSSDTKSLGWRPAPFLGRDLVSAVAQQPRDSLLCGAVVPVPRRSRLVARGEASQQWVPPRGVSTLPPITRPKLILFGAPGAHASPSSWGEQADCLTACPRVTLSSSARRAQKPQHLAPPGRRKKKCIHPTGASYRHPTGR